MTTKTRKFSYEDIDVIIEDVVKAIYQVQKENNGNVESMIIYIPDYFRTILNQYFFSKINGTNKKGIEFGYGASFYGIKKFFPSPFNQIIVSDLNAPNFIELTKIIQL
jgi:hypothetical protein